MPSIEKAIIHPFNAMSMADTIKVAVSGLLVVFLVLAVLALIIVVMSKVVGAMEGKKTAPEKATAAPAPAAAPAAPKEEQDDEELIAVLTAAICAELGTTPDVTRLTRIMRY